METYESDSPGEDIDDLPELMSDEYSLTEIESLLTTLADISEDDESSGYADSEVSE